MNHSSATKMLHFSECILQITEQEHACLVLDPTEIMTFVDVAVWFYCILFSPGLNDEPYEIRTSSEKQFLNQMATSRSALSSCKHHGHAAGYSLLADVKI